MADLCLSSEKNYTTDVNLVTGRWLTSLWMTLLLYMVVTFIDLPFPRWKLHPLNELGRRWTGLHCFFFFFFLLHSVLELLPFELWLGEGKGLWNTQNELLQHGTGEGMKWPDPPQRDSSERFHPFNWDLEKEMPIYFLVTSPHNGAPVYWIETDGRGRGFPVSNVIDFSCSYWDLGYSSGDKCFFFCCI